MKTESKLFKPLVSTFLGLSVILNFGCSSMSGLDQFAQDSADIAVTEQQYESLENDPNSSEKTQEAYQTRITESSISDQVVAETDKPLSSDEEIVTREQVTGETLSEPSPSELKGNITKIK